MTDIDDVYDDFDFDEAELQSPTDDERAFAKDVYKIFKDLIDNESGDICEKSVSRSNLVNCFNKHCFGKTPTNRRTDITCFTILRISINKRIAKIN